MHEKNLKIWKKVLESDLQYIVNELKDEIQAPAVVFLEGPLGSGKTTLCQYFCGRQTLSPTYSILSETDNILHADFYRVEKSDEFTHLEINLYLDKKDYFFAEWGIRWLDVLVPMVPEHFQYYKIKLQDSGVEEKNLRDITLYHVNPLL
jgi:tRNA threonylcarbamoyladenosine biosynthesis protein TsaE